MHAFTYDLEVDTSGSSPADCAALVLSRLRDGPPGQAFGHLARRERGACPADQAFSS